MTSKKGGEMDKKKLMYRLTEEIIALTSSPIYSYRQKNSFHPVIGEGNLDCKIMFIGEAPGKNEAINGRPFCGAAGKILDELLDSIGLERESVYVTNIVKDRPPDNRDPSAKEIAIYSPFLDRQIEIIQPSIIAPLGRFSMKYIMEKFSLANKLKPIGQIHGQIFKVNLPYGKVAIIPLYHPAVALYNRNTLGELKKDFRKLKRLI